MVIVGTGFVGISCAYTTLNQNACDELGLIDNDELMLLHFTSKILERIYIDIEYNNYFSAGWQPDMICQRNT